MRSFVFPFEELDPFLIGNQEGVEQAKTNKIIKRRRKEEERNISPLKSIISFFNNNLLYIKNTQKSNGFGDEGQDKER
jgi:hypothetical protein